MSNGHDEDNDCLENQKKKKKIITSLNTPNIFFLIYLNVRPIF